MSDNPYAAPEADEQVSGILSGSQKDLYHVARMQKGIIICILLYFIAMFGQLAIPQQLRGLILIGLLFVLLAGAVFVISLSVRVYGTALGIVLGILALIPCWGMIVLLVINSKATRIMKDNGIKVGLMGANLSEIERG